MDTSGFYTPACAGLLWKDLELDKKKKALERRLMDEHKKEISGDIYQFWSRLPQRSTGDCASDL